MLNLSKPLQWIRLQNNQKEDFKSFQDNNFYYIVGYTSAGAPYGVTWKEYEENIKEKNENNKEDEDGVDPFKDSAPF